VAEDLKIQALRTDESTDKIKAIGLVFREIDLESRPPIKSVQKGIAKQKDALVELGGDALGTTLRDLYVLGRFSEKFELRFQSDERFRTLVKAAFPVGSDAMGQLQAVFNRDLELAKIDSSSFWTRRTLGLSDSARLVDEQRSSSGGIFRNWLVSFPKRPYTSSLTRRISWERVIRLPMSVRRVKSSGSPTDSL